jgi:glycogen debranching enzyme
MLSTVPAPTVSKKVIDRALRIAVGDLVSNIHSYQDGLLEKPAPCLFAGLDYDMPWTRDAALNTWYGLGLLCPDVAKNTLLSVLKRESDGKIRIAGQYWDAIIWAHGAWQYYLYTSDQSFLPTAYEAVCNSLAFFEQTEFDADDGLFRGGACFQDGIAGYPDFFAPKKQDYSGILGWLDDSPSARAPTGEGVPCKALSTNCLYYRAYEVAGFLAEAMGREPDAHWPKKAYALRCAINDRFWDEEKGTYGYLISAPGDDFRQEGFGLAFALLFGVADNRQAARIFDAAYLSPHGMPCVWPTYSRYEQNGHFGRHSGTIWPQVNAAWALACQARGRHDLAMSELELLAEKACRDSEFAEVYHPVTGQPYGGLQESHEGGIHEYWVCHRQSWCASGFLGMALFCLNGIEISDRKPVTPEQLTKIRSLIPEIRINS